LEADISPFAGFPDDRKAEENFAAKLCCFSAEYTNFAECYDIALTGLNVEKLSKLK